MTAQLAFLILGAISFVAAAVMAVLAVLYYRRENIRAVRDDLSGKARLESIEEERLRRSDRSTKRGLAQGARKGTDAGVEGVGRQADRRRSGKAQSRGNSANGGESAGTRDGEGVMEKRSSKKGAKRGLRAKTSRKEERVPSPGREQGRRTAKSIADYQAEYTHGEDDTTWGSLVGEAPSREMGDGNDGSTKSAEENRPGRVSRGKARANASTEGGLREPAVSFAVVRRILVVHSDGTLGKQEVDES